MRTFSLASILFYFNLLPFVLLEDLIELVWRTEKECISSSEWYSIFLSLLRVSVKRDN